MARLFALAATAGVLSSAIMGPATAQRQHPDSTRHGAMPGMTHMAHDTMATMSLPLGIPHARMGSGTSWVPDAASHRDYQRMFGRWMLMGHGIIDLYYDHQGTRRGDDQIGSTNWLMGMAMHSLGGGMLQMDAMLSAEPEARAAGL